MLSGKGGTGKTTIASAFIRLNNAEAYADCDVDAPNLHLIMRQSSEPKRDDFFGLPKAEINPRLCIQCDLCRKNCTFDAIEKTKSAYIINPFACEGCGVCGIVCPVRAIVLKPAVAGELMLYQDKAVFSTAQIKMGSGTTGKLVSEVKKALKIAATNSELAIIDGSPGIGCPVIASLSGVDLVLVVTEPSVTGISDMERIIQTANKFQVAVAICINKYDTNAKQTKRIETYCKRHHILNAGNIPYDSDAIKAVNSGKSIVDFDCPAGSAVRKTYETIMPLLMAEDSYKGAKE